MTKCGVPREQIGKFGESTIGFEGTVGGIGGFPLEAGSFVTDVAYPE